MSYTEICDKFETAAVHVRSGTAIGSHLCTFFKSYKKSLDLFSQQILKHVENLSTELPKDAQNSTLIPALGAFAAHFKRILNQQTSLSRSIQLEIIDPLDAFILQLNTSNSQCVSKGAPTYRQLLKAKQKMEKLKNKHFISGEKAETAEAMISIDATPERQLKMQKQANYYRLLANRASETYEKSVHDANLCWNKYDSIIPGIMVSLQQNEESRIHFIKYTLEKYSKHHSSFQSILKSIFTEFDIQLANINSEIDVTSFVEANKSKRYKNREEFISYERWKKMSLESRIEEEKLNESYENLEESVVIADEDPDLELVNTVLDFLVPNSRIFTEEAEDLNAEKPEEKNLDANYYANLSELLHSQEGRELFIDSLEIRKSSEPVGYSKITQLAALIKSLLTMMMIEDDRDPNIITKIVTISHEFFTEDESGKKLFLSSFICSHNIWADRTRWESAIEFAIQSKIEADMESLAKQRRRNRRWSSIFTTIKQLFQKDLSQEREKSTAFLIVSQFNFHMIQMGVSHDTINSIILAVCQDVNLDSERTCILLSEVIGTKNLNGKIFEPRKVSSLEIRNKERLKFGVLLPIGLAIDFLDPLECTTIVLVCKKWKEVLYRHIIKKWLTEWDISEGKRKCLRTYAWAELLNAHLRPVEYSLFYDKLSAPSLTLKKYEEIITMDVARSFQSNHIVDEKSLSNILKSYVLYNPEVGYCQGMNFLAGTLLSQIQDEELTFKCLVGMIERFQMSNLYIHSLPKLKQFFYMLDRMIGIFLPEIHEQFKIIGLCSSHFSAPWFITMFASTLLGKFDILYPLWDLFLLEGWKVIFKASMAILKKVSQEMSGKQYEDIMYLLANIHSASCPIRVFDDQFLQEVKDMEISNALLRDLESEYEHLKIRAYNRSTK
ncbi:unnamed protein product [Blepharisma stoltei]|uniref:Rab-GAP TBC domain-containing protein n=1 Tax=Blepharisma stoltei TaxID=1481888 RepID=A0AAU9IT92_9CILI|nr:unnamed protein product [Blepharisma stoltei]